MPFIICLLVFVVLNLLSLISLAFSKNLLSSLKKFISHACGKLGNVLGELWQEMVNFFD
jgi:hypothetical protein